MSKSSPGIGGVTILLFITFLILKLTGAISWSWVWVTSPLWIGFGLWLAMALFVIGLVALTAGYWTRDRH